MNPVNRDRLYKVGVCAAYAAVPYSLSCMLIGGVYYGLFARREDHSGDGFLSLVIGAPITLPALAYARLHERLIKNPALRKREALHKRIGNALVTALHADGIPLDESVFNSFVIRVAAKPLDEHQRTRFGDAVARVVRQFPDIPLATICENLSPAQALDRSWAARNGFDDWAVEIGPACALCNQKNAKYWVFGHKAAEPWQSETWTASSFTTADEMPDPAQNSYVCEGCREKITNGTGNHGQDT